MTSNSGRRRSSSKSDTNIAGLYDLERTLGSGHFAVVKLARHVFTGENVAVKVIDKTKLDDVARAHLYQEVRCMKLVQHPNVVRLYEVIDTQTKLYLILEYGDGGDMYDYIMKHEGQGITEDKARHYFRQIVSAIDYCHRLHVVHRDLKPENVIFFKTQDVAKLTDFGFSNSFLPGQKLYTSCGSLAYSAPEILLGDSYDAPAVDVWSLGVILYMMVCGTGPFSHTNDSETLTMIMDCKYELPSHLSDDLKGLISRMLVREPQDRIALDRIADHQWFCDEASTMIPTPLISELNISKDIHMVVVQKMEDGKIAAKSEIKRSLEDNKYDHITATYFLLAERFLKRRHGSSAVHVKLEERHTYPYDDIYYSSESNLELTSESGLTASLGSDLEKREHSERREHNNTTDSIPENRTTYSTETSPLALTSQVRSTRPSFNPNLFKKTLSSPNILNEISEECESETDDSPMSSPKARHRAQRRRKFESKRAHSGCKLSPIHSRRSSCSSSDDDDSHFRAAQSAVSAIIGNGLPLQNVQGHSTDKETPTSAAGEKGKQKNFVEEIVTKLYTDPSFLSEKTDGVELKEDKENDSNLLNKLKLPIVTYTTKPLRHLSDTNLYILYSYNSGNGRKYLSDTNLQVLNMNLKNAKKSGFNCSFKDGKDTTVYGQLSSPSLSDFRGKSFPVDSVKRSNCSTIQEGHDGKLTNHGFSSLSVMPEFDDMAASKPVGGGRRESLQSSLSAPRESKSSVKYVYNEANNNAEDKPSETGVKLDADSSSHEQPVSFVLQRRSLTFVESACCTLL